MCVLGYRENWLVDVATNWLGEVGHAKGPDRLKPYYAPNVPEIRVRDISEPTQYKLAVQAQNGFGRSHFSIFLLL